MSIIGNIFCSDCDRILDISRTSSKKSYNLSMTPSSVSSDDDTDKITEIIDKILVNTDDDNIEFMEDIKAEHITSHEYFQKLNSAKKKIVSEKMEKYILKLSSSDNSTQSYYVCKSCSWSQKIKPGTQILSRIGGDNQASYLNIGKYKNKIFSRVLPFTKNYVCPNEKCPGKKNKSLHEAVIFRVNDTLRTMYTCCACQTVFSAQ